MARRHCRCSSQLRWPQDYRALLIYARDDADLLDPSAWQAMSALPFDRWAGEGRRRAGGQLLLQALPACRQVPSC